MVEFKVEIPEERKKELREGKRILEALMREIEKAREAGLDVSELETKAKETKESIEKILRVYG